MPSYALYLFVSAGITYLIRVIPLVLVKKKIKNKFLLSFLYYIPYAVLSVMTFPAIFYSTSSYISATVGTVIALILGYKNCSMVIVAAISSVAVFITELIMRLI